MIVASLQPPGKRGMMTYKRTTLMTRTNGIVDRKVAREDRSLWAQRMLEEMKMDVVENRKIKS